MSDTPLPRAWTTIASRTIGAVEWDGLPRAVATVDDAQQLRALQRARIKIVKDHRLEIMQIRAA